MTWREHISKDIRPFIEKLISESIKDKSLEKAKDPSKAQLWIALGILAKQNYNLELKTKYLEQALRDVLPRGKTKTQETLKAEAEVEKFISDIAQGKLKRKTKSKRKEIKTNF
ncbi:MAG: hypothetical protein QXP53_01600 [Candidatus Pacearchaeota archaeon]